MRTSAPSGAAPAERNPAGRPRRLSRLGTALVVFATALAPAIWLGTAGRAAGAGDPLKVLGSMPLGYTLGSGGVIPPLWVDASKHVGVLEYQDPTGPLRWQMYDVAGMHRTGDPFAAPF